MKTILSYAAERLALYAGCRKTKAARTMRVALWLVFIAACNVGNVYAMTPRAVAGIMREVKGV